VEPGPSPLREMVVIGPFAATAKRHYKHTGRLPFEPCTYRLCRPSSSAFSPSIALYLRCRAQYTAVLLQRPFVVTLDNLHDLHRDQPDSGERLRAPDGCLSLVVGSDQVRQLAGRASPSPSIPLSSSRHEPTDAKRQDGRSLAARTLGPAARATQEHSHSHLLCRLVSAASLQSYRGSSYGCAYP